MEKSQDTGGCKMRKVRINLRTYLCPPYPPHGGTDCGHGGWPVGTPWVCEGPPPGLCRPRAHLWTMDIPITQSGVA